MTLPCRSSLLAVLLSLLVAAVWGCNEPASGGGTAASSSQAAASSRSAASAGPVASADPSRPSAAAGGAVAAGPAVPLPRYQGSMLARDAGGGALWLADEDHATLRRVPLPLSDDIGAQVALQLPGPVAQVLPLPDGVLVTVREPGLLVKVRWADGKLSETARAVLPADAWGVAVTADVRLAVVTSAFASRVTAVRLSDMKPLWSQPVAREPRGVWIDSARRQVYVSHLTSPDLTKLALDESGRATTVRFEAAPLLTSREGGRFASLGYALAGSPDGSRLFAARHALGALGYKSWAGSSTVDVLLTADDSALARRPEQPQSLHRGMGHADDRHHITGPAVHHYALSTPRDMIYAAANEQLVVVYEGSQHVAVFDARAVAPSLAWKGAYSTQVREAGKWRTSRMGAQLCGAPSGVALSTDERHAYVYCRSTHNLMRLPIEHPDNDTTKGPREVFRVAKPPLSKQAELGRRLFYAANDDVMGWGMACASCHPDGRDDGHVWQQLSNDGRPARERRAKHGFIAMPVARYLKWTDLRGEARQTPTLAGRLAAKGPFGWRGQDKTLEDRILRGFVEHRWFADGTPPTSGATTRAKALAAYLREGLRPPPRLAGPLTAEQQRGKALFEDDSVGCASCHPAAAHFSDSTTHLSMAPADSSLARFAAYERPEYRTPSLALVGGTAPYFHNGSVQTLEELIDNNGDRMGRTNQLSAADRKALVAYLRTL